MQTYSPKLERKMQRLFSQLSERDRRRYATIEAEKLGHGGLDYISGLFGIDPKTIRRGQEELDGEEDSGGGVRKKGADAKP